MLEYARTAAGVAAVALVCLVAALEGSDWRWRRALDGMLWSTAVLAVARAGMVGWGSATTPRPWDSPAFYTVARSAVVEGSFYDPDTLRTVFDTTNGYFPDDWLAEIGYWYPPPSILTIYPAGHFSASTGLIVHHALQGTILIVAIALLGRWFPIVDGARAYAAASVVVLSLQPTIDAIHLGQIVFGSMLAIVVAVRLVSARPALAGVALGIGTLFKPLVIIVALLWAAIGRPRVFLGALVALAGSAAVTAAMFGVGVYSDFIRFGPSDRSAQLSLNPVIQSLNGQLRRFLDQPPDSQGAMSSILHPPTMVASFIVLLVTLAVLVHARGRASDIETVGLTLTASLLLYPNTLVSTLSLIAVPIAIVLHRARDPRSSMGAASLLAIGTVALTGGIVAPFFGLLFLWVASIVVVLRELAPLERADSSSLGGHWRRSTGARQEATSVGHVGR